AHGELYRYMRDVEPYTASPADLPEADEDQILAFIADVHEIVGIAKYDSIRAKASEMKVQWLDTDVGEIRTPPMPDSVRDAAMLVDGRRAWLLIRSMRWARYNAGIVAPVVGDARAVNLAGVD